MYTIQTTHIHVSTLINKNLEARLGVRLAPPVDLEAERHPLPRSQRLLEPRGLHVRGSALSRSVSITIIFSVRRVSLYSSAASAARAPVARPACAGQRIFVGVLV